MRIIRTRMLIFWRYYRLVRFMDLEDEIRSDATMHRPWMDVHVCSMQQYGTTAQHQQQCAVMSI